MYVMHKFGEFGFIICLISASILSPKDTPHHKGAVFFLILV